MLLVTRGGGEGLRPNELGRVLILEYHRIDDTEGPWTRTPEHFRDDLESLYARGYRLISLRDLVAGRIAIPAGTAPVVLTFDDSSPGQFRYVATPEGPRLDPRCAVAILEAFSDARPEFGHSATFFVLPAANRPNRLFDQPEDEMRKLQYLVRRGFEIGNHTLWHANLARYEEHTVRRQIAEAQRSIQRFVPGYQMRALALPFGAYPRELAWAVGGTVDGITYEHDAILMVSGGPAPSPFARAFDPLHLPRVQATSSGLRYWLDEFDRRPRGRFVSDGDADAVTIPAGAAAQLRRPLAPGLRVIEAPP
jgi:peptidoglycan/xylan/chitin deacetylase (PgdA/CDA1 family)